MFKYVTIVQKIVKFILTKMRKINMKNNQVEVNYFDRNRLVLYKVPPVLTDPNIDNWLDDNYVAFNQSMAHKNKLFLFLSGSFGKPGQQKLFFREVANLGYLVINLSYPNSWTIANLCQNSENPSCHEKARLAIIYGQENSRELTILTANSIQNRLAKLLLFLAEYNPENGWLNYLDDDMPRWESIIVAGHSQGGGHAAMIAKDNLVARVIMLAAPADYSKINENMASWLYSHHVTPSNRYYGFVHVQDPAYLRIAKAWELLGLSDYGDMVNIDEVEIPYGNSHQLLTARLPATEGRFHGSIFNDAHTPKLNNGNPQFKKVWQYLCEHQQLSY